MRMNKRELLWRFGRPAAVMLGGLLLGLGAGILMDKIELRQAGEAQTLPAEAPADGIGRITAARHLGGAWTAMPERAERIAPEHYTEGDGPAPEWYRPEEPMAAVWEASCRQVVKANKEAGSGDFTGESQGAEKVKDIGCPDWNADSAVTGWDGHRAEIWEMDLFARIFYKEFWQPDITLCEAGCDAILRLWESGEKGRTLGEVLSSTAENGAWTYSTYPEVWATDYDPDGLAWCRAFCEARFYAGPVWIAPYFRLDYYHDWAVPAYQIGNVYFSVGAQG